MTKVAEVKDEEKDLSVLATVKVKVVQMAEEEQKVKHRLHLVRQLPTSRPT